jgi:hypothetical protein
MQNRASLLFIVFCVYLHTFRAGAQTSATNYEISSDFSNSLKETSLNGLKKKQPITFGGYLYGLRGNVQFSYEPSFSSFVKDLDTIGSGVNCHNGSNENASPVAVTLAETGIKAACSSAKEEDLNRYTSENCRFLNTCADSKMPRDRINLNTVERLAAEDYAVLLLEDRLPRMERIEALRRFAEKKYGADFGASCRPLFRYTSSDLSAVCDRTLVESGFQSMTKTCSAKNNSCYSPGPDFGKNIPDKETAMSHFFSQKIETKVTESLAFDNESLDTLSQILSSKEEKSEEKIKAVFAHLKQLNDENKIDPVFALDFESYAPSKVKDSIHYNFFKEMAEKNLSRATVKAQLEKHRRDTASAHFKKDCQSSSTVADICQRVTAVSNGGGGLYFDKDRASVRLKSFDQNQIEILKYTYPQEIKDDRDARIVLNAGRCVALGVVLAKNKGGVPGLPLSNIGLGGNLYPNINSVSASEIKSNDSVIADFSKSETAMGHGLDFNKPKDVPGEPLPEKKESPSSNPINNGSKTLESANGNNLPNGLSKPAINTLPGPNYNFGGGDESAGPKNNSAPSEQESLSNQISTLSNKLKATEEQLSKLSEKQKKGRDDVAEEESPTTDSTNPDDGNQKISNLQKQISDLKAASLKPNDRINEKAKSEGDMDNPPSRALASTERFSDTARGMGKESSGMESFVRANPVSISPTSEPSSFGAKTAASSAPPSALSSAAQAAGKPLLVLSKTDGLSAEKMNERIGDKVLELDGQSFEIEENGVKVEIIPVMKDGKLFLDEKGKPLFKKVKKEKGGKERVPASVTNRADLMIREEADLRIDRAKYQNLKNMTNQAVQKGTHLP